MLSLSVSFRVVVVVGLFGSLPAIRWFSGRAIPARLLLVHIKHLRDQNGFAVSSRQRRQRLFLFKNANPRLSGTNTWPDRRGKQSCTCRPLQALAKSKGIYILSIRPWTKRKHVKRLLILPLQGTKFSSAFGSQVVSTNFSPLPAVQVPPRASLSQFHQFPPPD